MDLRKHIIISGAAGTGKSTLLSALKNSGYNGVEEVSRKLIDQEIAVNGKALPWRDTAAFVMNCVRETKKTLKPPTTLTFCDRGMPDHAVYMQMVGLEVPSSIQQFPFGKYYGKHVFYCPNWEEIYVQEPQRPESFEYQLKLDLALREVYRNYGFLLIEIPKISVSERVAFVTKTLNSLQINGHNAADKAMIA